MTSAALRPPFDIAGDLDTPVSAYMKLADFRPHFLLESVEGGERLGRYSFIGLGAGLEVRLEHDALYLDGARHPVPASSAALLDVLRGALAAAPRPQPDIPGVPLAGGLVGYAAYDVVRHFERLPAPAHGPSSTPVLHYVAPRSLLVFDHLTRRIALVHAGSDAERRALRREVIAALRGALPEKARTGRYGPAQSSCSRAEHIAGVRRVQEYIAAGDVYQLVLSMRFAGRHELDPFQAYRALRLINPSPYLYYCALGDVTVVGSSPEALVKVKDGVAQLRPIAGTRPRADDPEVDRVRELELLADPKENAEHVMLVDLARNDLGRVARPGSVHVDPFRAIERYSHVMHIVSNVEGKLAPKHDAVDALAAGFPAGTVSGAPKVRAMEIIDELEKEKRGLYAGSVGYFSAAGEMDTCIVLRTALVKDGVMYVQAGAGIVADSNPDSEQQECVNKSRALFRAAEEARRFASAAKRGQ